MNLHDRIEEFGRRGVFDRIPFGASLERAGQQLRMCMASDDADFRSRRSRTASCDHLAHVGRSVFLAQYDHVRLNRSEHERLNGLSCSDDEKKLVCRK
jgi:hypothetical protein